MTCPPPDSLSEDDFDIDDDYDRNYQEIKAIQFERKTESEDNLKKAIENGILEEVTNIVTNDLKGNVNIKFDSKWSPLSLACFYLKENIVEYLLDNGAEVNLPKIYFQPLIMACTSTSEDEQTAHRIVSKLIERDAYLNASEEFGETALMRAATKGRKSLVKLLINSKCNIEMRDQNGWTAVFFAVHYNQPKCLRILLSNGARFDISTSGGHTPQTIAGVRGFSEILDILGDFRAPREHHVKFDFYYRNISHPSCVMYEYTSWQDFYPGLRDENIPMYLSDIPVLLYGMNCDRLYKIFEDNPVSLREFLLLEEDDMKKLGIDMPFDRQRMKVGLKKFHMKNWLVKSVAGMEKIGKKYSILDCVHALVTHHQQFYILDATLTYITRGLKRSQNEIGSEPPEAETAQKLQQAAQKVISSINNIRRELKVMKRIHEEISDGNETPVDYIAEKSTKDIAMEMFHKIGLATSIGITIYYARKYFMNAFEK